MFQFIFYGALSWLPAPLAALVFALIVFFFIFVMFRLVEFIIKILTFVFDILGGALKKVVLWFLG